MLAGSFAFYSQTTHFYEPGGAAHFIMANLIAVCLFAWVVYVQSHSKNACTHPQTSSILHHPACTPSSHPLHLGSVLVRYDSGRLCERMQPDDYMKGVIYFYTDFLMVCCCCLFAGCMGSAAS